MLKTAIIALGILLASACQGWTAETWADLNRRVTEMYQAQKYAEALPVAEKALSLAESQYGHASAEAALSHNNLGTLYKKRNMLGEAERHYLKALDISEELVGPKHPDLAVTLNNLAMLEGKKGNWTMARSYSIRAMSILESSYGPDHPMAVQARQRYYELEREYKP